MHREDARIFKAEFERFRHGTCMLHWRMGGDEGTDQQCSLPLANIEEAIRYVPELLKEHGFMHIDAVGHRVAHGGEHFHEAVIIDATVMEHIECCTPLAPLHNPAHIAAIRLAQEVWQNVPHIAVFDTAFHHTMPERAYRYAIPKAWHDAGVRRYGFHGTSHKYVALCSAQAVHRPITDLKIISCHLGNGASVCAINRGFSLDTSMGMTPLEGLMMGTRCGDIDPGMSAHLERTLGLSPQEIEHTLYHESGLKAIAGTHDLRDIEHRAEEGNADAQTALHMYAYRVQHYIGAYAAALGGVDVLSFTGGIGENSASMRRRICERLAFMGIALDDGANQAVRLHGRAVCAIQSFDARVRVLVMQTNEQWMIAKEAQQCLSKQHHPTAIDAPSIPVAVSARHVHLSQEAVEALFGKGYALRKMRDLSQPEGWAAEETVEIVGIKGSLQRVRVLGPVRSRTQIEISKTDSFALGIDVPVRASGVLDHTPYVTLRTEHGEIRTDGLIIAARHIHMSVSDAQRMGVRDGSYVHVRVGKAERSILFSNVLIRVKDSFVTEMHIDTDEANAAGITTHTEGELIVQQDQHHASLVGREMMSFTQ